MSKLNKVSCWFICITTLSVISDNLVTWTGSSTCDDKLFPESVSWLNPLWWLLNRMMQCDGAIVPIIILFYKSHNDKRASFIDHGATRFGSDIDEFLDNESDNELKS